MGWFIKQDSVLVLQEEILGSVREKMNGNFVLHSLGQHDSINEAKLSPGSQNSNHIYKYIIQLLYGLNGLIGLTWGKYHFYHFLQRKYFPIYASDNSMNILKTNFYVGTICAAVSLQLYIKCFYIKIELMYKNTPLCHNKVTSTQ